MRRWFAAFCAVFWFHSVCFAEPRVFGRAPTESAAPQPAPAASIAPPQPSPQPTVEQLQAQIAELQARQNGGQTIVIQQQAQQSQYVDGPKYIGRTLHYFDIGSLSVRDQARYIELEQSNKRLGFPIVLTAASLGFFVLVTALFADKTTCWDPGDGTDARQQQDLFAGSGYAYRQTPGYVDCSMPPGMYALGAITTLGGVATGVLMLMIRGRRRHEFNVLTRKGMHVGLAANGLRLTF